MENLKEENENIAKISNLMVKIMNDCIQRNLSLSETKLILESLQKVTRGEPYEKFTPCKLNGCTEVQYLKQLSRELVGKIAVLDGNGVRMIPLWEVHSLSYSSQKEGYKGTMVRLVNGDFLPLEGMTITQVKDMFPKLMFATRQGQLLCWYSYIDHENTPAGGVIRMQGKDGVEEFEVSPEKYKKFLKEFQDYDTYTRS